MSCIVAWRRAVIEMHHREGPEAATHREERRSALQGYWSVSAGTDPLTADVLRLPVGTMPQNLFLLSLYRLETGASIAWGLGLRGGIPPAEEPADYSELEKMFPLEGPPSALIDRAELRSKPELLAAAEKWRTEARIRRSARNEAEGEDTSIQFSRTLERARGLLWLQAADAEIHEVSP